MGKKFKRRLDKNLYLNPSVISVIFVGSLPYCVAEVWIPKKKERHRRKGAISFCVFPGKVNPHKMGERLFVITMILQNIPVKEKIEP